MKDVMQPGGLIAGVDEVGRGPLIGDVVCAAVILDDNAPIIGLNDSKKISEKKREQLFPIIQEQAIAIGVGRALPSEIDTLNILHATMLAMTRAVNNLSTSPDFVFVDGNRLPDWEYQSQAIVKGDGLVDEIKAASIIAKVIRDREMIALSQEYPEFNFQKHKGYPTKEHLDALERFGVLPQHRRSFGPVKRILAR